MLGIDISDRSVKMAQLDDSRQKLLSKCWHEIPEGVMERGLIKKKKVLMEVLDKAIKACRLDGNIKDTVVASIPETQSFLRVVELPPMAFDEMDEAVRWEVARHIPFGLENVYVDWQPVNEGHYSAAGRHEVLVGAAQNKVVDPLLEVLHALNLDVAALELESQAIVRSLVSPDLKKKQGLLIVDLGGVATNVIVYDQGVTRFMASLEKGVHGMQNVLTAEEASELDVPSQKPISNEQAMVIAGKLRPKEEELVVEMMGVIDFYGSTDKEHKVQEILLTGGGSNFPGLDAVFLSVFENVHVQRGNPWVNILPTGGNKESPMSIRESVHFSTALGLALRQVDN